MKKVLLVLALVIPLAGCGQAQRMEAIWTGWSEHCIDGVKYIQFASGATVKYNRQGQVDLCSK